MAVKKEIIARIKINARSMKLNISEILETAPALKSRASEEAEQARLKWLEGKEAIKRLEASFALSVKAAQNKITATELKYCVDNNNEIHKERLQVIILESQYRSKEIEANKYDDEFTSAKMLARLRISEMQSIEWGGKNGV